MCRKCSAMSCTLHDSYYCRNATTGKRAFGLRRSSTVVVLTTLGASDEDKGSIFPHDITYLHVLRRSVPNSSHESTVMSIYPSLSSQVLRQKKYYSNGTIWHGLIVVANMEHRGRGGGGECYVEVRSLRVPYVYQRPTFSYHSPVDQRSSQQ